MNAVLAAINIYFITQLLREQHDPATFGVIEVGQHDQYLRHVLDTHRVDIRRFQPDWGGLDKLDQRTGQLDPREDNHAFVVVRGDETVGVVLLRADDGVARVQLDYVTPKYRGFSPGESCWRRSNVLRDRGFRQVVAPDKMVDAYYGRLGFRRDGQRYVLAL